MDRAAWQVTIHGVAKGQTRQSSYHFHFFPGGPLIYKSPTLLSLTD